MAPFIVNVPLRAVVVVFVCTLTLTIPFPWLFSRVIQGKEPLINQLIFALIVRFCIPPSGPNDIAVGVAVRNGSAAT